MNALDEGRQVAALPEADARAGRLQRKAHHDVGERRLRAANQPVPARDASQ